MPRQVLYVATHDPATRYGVFGLGGFEDSDHRAYFYPVIGGSIDYGNGSGMTTMYRVPVINTGRKPDGSSPLDTFKKEVMAQLSGCITTFKTIVATAVDQARDWMTPDQQAQFANIIDHAASVMDLTLLRSILDLNLFFYMKLWQAVQHKIYEAFPRDIINFTDGNARSERFYVPMFDHVVKRDDSVQDPPHVKAAGTLRNGVEYYISPATVSQIGLTRVAINCGIWEALCHIFGYTHAGAAMLWEYYYYAMAQKQKKPGDDVILWLLSSDSQNPFKTSFPEVDLATEICVRLFLFRIWLLTRDSIDIGDWREDVRYGLVARQMTNEAFDIWLTPPRESWKKTQVIVPEGDLPHLAEMKILPFRAPENSFADALKHDASGAVVDDRVATDYAALVKEPVLTMARVDFTQINIAQETPLDLVILKTVNFAKRTNILAFNRLLGFTHGMEGEGEAAVCVRYVYPAFLSKFKPITIGMNTEPQYWPLIYSSFGEYQALFELSTLTEIHLGNQASIYGPNFYLFNCNRLTYVLPRGETGMVDLFIQGADTVQTKLDAIVAEQQVQAAGSEATLTKAQQRAAAKKTAKKTTGAAAE